MKYLLTAYKPNSDDYCRGCHMASYSSDYQELSTNDKSELLDFWAGLLATELEINETGYTFSLYGDYINDRFDDYYDLEKQAQALAARISAERDEAEKLKEQAKKDRLAKEQEDRERAQYEALAKKFGGQ